MIPLVLHQTWKSAALPPDLAAFQRSFVAHNPGITLRFYDDAAMAAFVQDRFPAYAPLFESFRFPVQKADLFRLLVVLDQGGIYADMDMECLAPLGDLLDTDKAVFGIEAQVTATRQTELGYAQPFQVANCIFAAPAGNGFIAALVADMATKIAARPVEVVAAIEDATGPKALTRFFYASRPRDVGVLEQIYWVPPDLYADLPLLRTRIRCRHHFLGSWKEQRRGMPLQRRLIERNPLPNPFPASPWHDFGWG
jgi:hypothetical protein